MEGAVGFLILWGLSLGLTALCWRFGGKPERMGAALIAAAYAVSIVLDALRPDVLTPGIAIVDLWLAMGLAILSMIFRRWWLLVATANAALVVIAHASVILDSEIYQRAYVAYQILPGLLIPLAAGAGALERWLAGEPSPPGWLWKPGI